MLLVVSLMVEDWDCMSILEILKATLMGLILMAILMDVPLVDTFPGILTDSSKDQRTSARA